VISLPPKFEGMKIIVWEQPFIELRLGQIQLRHEIIRVIR